MAIRSIVEIWDNYNQKHGISEINERNGIKGKIRGKQPTFGGTNS